MPPCSAPASFIGVDFTVAYASAHAVITRHAGLSSVQAPREKESQVAFGRTSLVDQLE